MMHLSSVVLPKCSIYSSNLDLDLVIQSSILLQFPEKASAPTTGTELLKLVTEKNLWIARTGACYLYSSNSIHGKPIQDVEQRNRLAEWVETSEVWDRVGLLLKYRQREATELYREHIFSIQHPDLSSALIAPEDAYRAEFRSLTCSFDFLFRGDETNTYIKPNKRRKCQTGNENLEKSSAAQHQPGDELYKGIAPEDQMAIEDFIISLGKTLDKPRIAKDAGNTMSFSERRKSFHLCEEVHHMLDSALEILVLGTAKKFKEVNVIQSTPTQALTRIAPAVFHVPYLKALSDRASLLSSIATSLARMKNAESPTLRQKLVSFGNVLPNRSSSFDQDEKIVRGVENATWKVLLATLTLPVVRNTAVREYPSKEESQGGMISIIDDGILLKGHVASQTCIGSGKRIDPPEPFLSEVASCQQFHSEMPCPGNQIDEPQLAGFPHNAVDSSAHAQMGISTAGLNHCWPEEGGYPGIQGDDQHISFANNQLPVLDYTPFYMTSIDEGVCGPMLVTSYLPWPPGTQHDLGGRSYNSIGSHISEERRNKLDL